MSLIDAIHGFAFLRHGTGTHHVPTMMARMHELGTQKSPAILQARCDFIAQDSHVFFQENALDLATVTPLDNGGTSLVLDCSDEFVLKIKTGAPYDYTQLSPKIVHYPQRIGHSKELDISYELTRRAEINPDMTFKKFIGFQMNALRYGCFISDYHRRNFGHVTDPVTGTKELRVIDTGAVIVLPRF